MMGLVAAAKVATDITRKYRQITNIYLFADNAAVVLNIYGVKDVAGQRLMRSFTHYIDNFFREHKEGMVTVQWCPGHKDIEGNKRADKAAKEGALMWQSRFVTLTHAKQKTKEHVIGKWRAEWLKTAPYRRFHNCKQTSPKHQTKKTCPGPAERSVCKTDSMQNQTLLYR
ncbi:hypothetical protein J132_02999 [Termitomyces sp. J132]|nr:hypothetical protein J132_02999 [Termitomyces sp. J132]